MKYKSTFEELEISKELESKIDKIAVSLSRKIERELFREKYAPVLSVLKLVGAGAFLAASFMAPNLPKAFKPLISDTNDYEAWKRFNFRYLKRTLQRLEKERLVEIKNEDNMQIVEITNKGRKRILKCALDELTIEKPKSWDGQWRLVSYDIPGKLKNVREIFNSYLRTWSFYPVHESVFLHAYPCVKEVGFLREYLGIGKYVRIFKVSAIENDQQFRDFFGV